MKSITGYSIRTIEGLRSAIHRNSLQARRHSAPPRYPRRLKFLDDSCAAREAGHL